MSGLYLEGADWDVEMGCLVKSKPKVLTVQLPILRVVPIETQRLRLQVWTTVHVVCVNSFIVFPPNVCVFFFTEYIADTGVYYIITEKCNGCGFGF